RPAASPTGPLGPRSPDRLLALMDSTNRGLIILTASANLLRSKENPSSASLGVLPGGREWIQKTDQRSRQRAESQRESEAHREQQCSFWRNAVTAKERNHGELPQTPASDRDRDERHADHDREQYRGVWERQREALCPSDRPNDDNGGGVNETSNDQDYGPLRSG